MTQTTDTMTQHEGLNAYGLAYGLMLMEGLNAYDTAQL